MRGHLIRRNGTYWFRRRVPKDLALKVGKSEIRRSLETRCPREARLRSSHAWIATEGLFSAMRKPTLSEQQVQLVIRRLLDEPVHQSETAAELMDQARRGDWSFFDTLFSPSGEGYLESLSEPDRQKLGDIMERMVDFEAAEVSKAEQSATLLKSEISETAQLAAEAEKFRWMDAALRSRNLAQRLANRLQVEVEVNRRLQAHSPALPPASTPPRETLGFPVSHSAPPSPPPSPVRKVGKNPLFSELTDRFIAEKTRAVEGGYTKQTVAQTRATFRLWLDLMGDRPVGEYTGKDAMAFRELLLRMPASHGKAVETGIRLKAMDAIHQADKREISEQITIPRLSMKTTKRHFSSLSQYWKWLLPGDYVDRNIFGGFSFPGTKSKKAARDDWSDDQLKLFYSSKWIEAAPRNSAHRWLLTIALFSGLRLEEIARLRPQDIVNIDGIDAFYIHEHEDGWSPKTEAGERYVPIHPFLIDLGFLDIVNQRRESRAPRIWKDLSPSGPDQDFGVEYGRKFGKWRDTLGIPRKVVFHSSRHNVSTILRNAPPDAVREAWIDAVLGHENGSGSVGASVYLKRIGIQNLKRAVELIDYADDVKAAIRAAMLG